MTSLARLTDLTDWTDLTDKFAQTGAEGKCREEIPLISRHGLFPAASDSSVMSVLSVKSSRKTPPPLAD